ncbi:MULTISPECIES: ArsR/SmtB family transcription factor [Mycobacterium]|uniref:Transcriptional regulatory protein n=1 Tax=Mycobacterium marinum (strain ATCC BAA-535 / M) TaxID=216594 RepID=B2HN90_MYCMM|nr:MULTISPECIES: metalloregulator ArsR/SmtB family transcription factor [Mycobacterium]ACC40588.1 transcriptional regulatory protein [Mycobacterium marinum M]MDM4142069.1 metalloregulator ArsR/SmtB family transcription factor [Mycobacterium sp. FLAC0960]
MPMKIADDAPPTASPREDLAGAVALFHSLSDPTRLAIARRLADGERRVVDLTRELGLPQSTVSSHLACLRDCGLIAGRPEGRQVFYALAVPDLLDLFAAAETVLAATGNAVTLCPNYGTRPTRASASRRRGVKRAAPGVADWSPGR